MRFTPSLLGFVAAAAANFSIEITLNDPGFSVVLNT